MAKQPNMSSKVESTAHPSSEASGGANKLEVIVKVKTPGYHPEAVDVRAQISPQIFTATVLRSDLESLEQDEQVVSVSLGRALTNPG